jgi:serine/threonine-protein kinase HipA
MENPPRLSLAGAQSKFAVYKSDGKYYRSGDKTPTTHIIKINNKRFPNLLHNELFNMKLAKIILTNVPEVELLNVEGRLFLEVTRYDRYIKNSAEPEVYRIHQEDFCQALGIVSGKKYQAGGGAKLKDCYQVINDFSENRLTDIFRFMGWIIFNYLIGNTDAHAKNLSLLHSDSGIKLAPFYDLLSTEVYSEKIIDHETAMLINGKGKHNSLKPNDFTSLFESLDQNPINMMKTLKDMFINIIPAAEKLRDELAASFISQDVSVYEQIIAIIKKRFTVLFG